jgi:hypothetical protein
MDNNSPVSHVWYFIICVTQTLSGLIFESTWPDGTVGEFILWLKCTDTGAGRSKKIRTWKLVAHLTNAYISNFGADCPPCVFLLWVSEHTGILHVRDLMLSYTRAQPGQIVCSSQSNDGFILYIVACRPVTGQRPRNKKRNNILCYTTYS